MKMIYYIMQRVALSLLVVLTLWAGLFYYTIVEEVNDETDDVLEDYAAMIIQRFLAGEEMPTVTDGTNNTYYLRSVSADSVAHLKRRKAFTNEDIYIKYKKETEPARVLRYLFRDEADTYFEITVATPTIDKSDLITAIWRSLVILFASLLGVILLINAFAIRGGLRPLRKFLDWLHTSSVENSSTLVIKENNLQEIKELGIAIRSFASRGKRAFEQQKEFIGNASHELQTPVAVCMNRLEMLCETNLNEEQLADVAACMSTLGRLSKLNKSLLMLSKIDNGEFESEAVSINEIVRLHAPIFEEIYDNLHITLTVKELGNCTITANKELATTLVTNLIKNSYSHNIEGGEVTIEIGTDYIVVANSGSGVALNKEKIFDRFYRDNNKAGSHGLGLPITLSICKLYDFKIDYDYRENRHYFKVTCRP